MQHSKQPQNAVHHADSKDDEVADQFFEYDSRKMAVGMWLTIIT